MGLIKLFKDALLGEPVSEYLARTSGGRPPQAPAQGHPGAAAPSADAVRQNMMAAMPPAATPGAGNFGQQQQAMYDNVQRAQADFAQQQIAQGKIDLTPFSDQAHQHLTSPEFQNAAMQATQDAIKQQQAANLAANPGALEPVNGVTIEQYAGAAAAMAQLGAGATPQQMAQALGQFNLDRASYDAADAGWQARMQNDPTGAIATKYAEAFAGPSGGAAPGGGEPCTFERFVEIMAAQSAWTAQGFDVNAKLPAVFGINAADYSNYSAYWSPKMMTDVNLATQMGTLQAQFMAKYSGPDPDSGLTL